MPKEQFRSISEYVCFVLTQMVSEQVKEQPELAFSPEDEEKIKDRLKSLGYL